MAFCVARSRHSSAVGWGGAAAASGKVGVAAAAIVAAAAAFGAVGFAKHSWQL